MQELWRLKEVKIRDIWSHEQYDFSAWLAKKENIDLLWETIWVSLTDIETEKFVWSYRCDIIWKDEITGKTVLIENQLEPTNHDHLWKIITYASWLDASVVVWVVEEAREEHASAIEWLNKHTDDEVAFFLIEIHTYKIWDSEPAPMFKIIEQPNDFARTAKELSHKDNLKPTHAKRLEFWNKFRDVVIAKWRPFNAHKPSTDHWTTIAIWTSWVHISVDLINREHKIRVWLWIDDDKELFDRIYEHKEEIEKVAWIKFDWERLPNKKASSICMYIDWLDFDKQDNYPELMNKSIENVLLIKEVFKPYL